MSNWHDAAVGAWGVRGLRIWSWVFAGAFGVCSGFATAAFIAGENWSGAFMAVMAVSCAAVWWFVSASLKHGRWP